MTKEKATARPRYLVVWCSHLPRDEYGDCIPDRATFRDRAFPSMGLAVAFAKRCNDQFGAPRVKVQEWGYDQTLFEEIGRKFYDWYDEEEYEVDPNTGEYGRV